MNFQLFVPTGWQNKYSNEIFRNFGWKVVIWTTLISKIQIAIEANSELNGIENETKAVQTHSCYKREQFCCEGRNTSCKGQRITENIFNFQSEPTKECYCDDSCSLLKG